LKKGANMSVKPVGTGNPDAWTMLSGADGQEQEVEETTSGDAVQRSLEPGPESQDNAEVQPDEPPLLVPTGFVLPPFVELGTPQRAAVEMTHTGTPTSTPPRVASPPIVGKEAPFTPTNTSARVASPPPVAAPPREKKYRKCWEAVLNWVCCKKKAD
jgi:hypothetical protein